jgi:hypothetical protein
MTAVMPGEPKPSSNSLQPTMPAPDGIEIASSLRSSR